MEPLLVEVNIFPGEYIYTNLTAGVYDTYTPVCRCICVNIHLSAPIMYGFAIVYARIYHFDTLDQREGMLDISHNAHPSVRYKK